MRIVEKQLSHLNEAQGPHDPELIDRLTALETLIESQMSFLAQLDQLKTQCVSSEDLAHMAVQLDSQSEEVTRSLDDLHRIRRKLLQSQGDARMRAVQPTAVIKV